jgi:hypothetical protein
VWPHHRQKGDSGGRLGINEIPISRIGIGFRHAVAIGANGTAIDDLGAVAREAKAKANCNA